MPNHPNILPPQRVLPPPPQPPPYLFEGESLHEMRKPYRR